MRQRLLLVAGWALAAVGTSVVASAAVAATSGQVTDRALRPLTAAEVAALPRGFLEVPSESLASGDSSIRALENPRKSDTPELTVEDPAGAEGDSSFGPGFDPLTEERSDGPDVAPEPDPVSQVVQITTDTHIEHVEGGSVSLALTDDRIRVLSATPRLGWQIEAEFVNATQLLISFTDGQTTWTLNASSVDGEIQVITRESGGGLQ